MSDPYPVGSEITTTSGIAGRVTGYMPDWRRPGQQLVRFQLISHAWPSAGVDVGGWMVRPKDITKPRPRGHLRLVTGGRLR